jgi:hypothetical protein
MARACPLSLAGPTGIMARRAAKRASNGFPWFALFSPRPPRLRASPSFETSPLGSGLPTPPSSRPEVSGTCGLATRAQQSIGAAHQCPRPAAHPQIPDIPLSCQFPVVICRLSFCILHSSFFILHLPSSPLEPPRDTCASGPPAHPPHPAQPQFARAGITPPIGIFGDISQKMGDSGKKSAGDPPLFATNTMRREVASLSVQRRAR